MPLGKTQMSEFGFSGVGRTPADRAGPQPVESRLHRGRVVVGLGGIRRRRCGADRARQRRRRVDPNSGGVQRPCRSEADARAAAAGQGDRPDAAAPRRQRRGDAGRCATPRRSCARPSGSTATRSCPAIGDVTQPGKQRLRIAVCTKSILREASPEIRELTLKTAALLEELGHKVTEIDNPVPARFKDDFLALLVVPGVRGRARRTPHVRPELRPHQAGQPDAGTRPQCRPQPAQGAAGHRAAVGVAPDHRSDCPVPTTRC